MKTLREYIDLVAEEEDISEDELQEDEQEVDEAATPEALQKIDDLYNNK